MSSSIYSHFSLMRSDLNRMEEKGIVDPSFTAKIDFLKMELNKMKQYWADQKNVSSGSAFIFYSAMHNSTNVLDKMKERFIVAQEKFDNPKIACDSLLVMPIISEVYQKTTEAVQEGANLNIFMANETLKLVSALRKTAKLANLLPTPNEEVKKVVDSEQLKMTALELDKKFVATNLLNHI